MATIEHEQARSFPVTPPRTERVVFVTEGAHRARRLRYGAAAVGLLACLWLAGLGIGMLGLGRLPGMSLPVADRGGDGGGSEHATKVARPASQPSRADASAAHVTWRAAQTMSQASSASQARASRSKPAAKVAAAARPRVAPRPATPAASVQPPAQAPVTAQPVRRGLVRRGLTAPPGQARTTTATQPPAAPPGQSRRHGGSTTTAPAPAPAAAPLSPGQQKKLDEPKPKG